MATPKALITFFLAAFASASLSARQQPVETENPSSSTEQLAATTGLAAQLTELKSVLAQPSANPLLVLYLRQELLESILGIGLQVDATTARIDSEIAQASEFSNLLQDKRNRAEDRINLAGIGTGGALGIVSSALQLSSKHAKAGNSVGIGAGVIVTVLSVISLRAQSGKSGVFAFRSNMLARLFERPADSTDIYSPAVLAFLNSVPEIDPDKMSRKRRLLETWKSDGRLSDPATPEGQAKIARLTGTFTDNQRLSINDLEDRRAMLVDLRAKLTLMKRDLASFLASLPHISRPT